MTSKKEEKYVANPIQIQQLTLQQIQVLLAEQRTHVAEARLGLTLITVPLTACGFLVAMNHDLRLISNMYLFLAIIFGLISIAARGLYIYKIEQKKRKQILRQVEIVKRRSKDLAEIIIV